MFFKRHDDHGNGAAGSGCGGHGGSDASPDERQEPREEEKKPQLGEPGADVHSGEPATVGGKHRGC